MSPTDITRIQGVAGVRPEARSADLPAAPEAPRKAPEAAQPAVEVQAAPVVDTSQAPVDTNRVAEIRAAIEQGNYPLMPARIADAMIAAPILLSAEA